MRLKCFTDCQNDIGRRLLNLPILLSFLQERVYCLIKVQIPGNESFKSLHCLKRFTFLFYLVIMNACYFSQKQIIPMQFQYFPVSNFKQQSFFLSSTTIIIKQLKLLNYIKMLRKNIRQRREYLYTLEREAELKQKSEKKRKILESQQNNSKLPTQLFKEKQKLQQQLQADDMNTLIPRTHVDDQYANLLYSDPQVLITTSRDPSSRLMQFLKEMAIVMPNTQRINRGAYVMQDLVQLCLNKNLSDLVLLHQHRGVPDGMIVCHFPVGPTVYFGLENVVLRHDVKDKLANMPEQYPHLIFNNFSTKLGDRIVNILKHLFPVPKVESKRTLTFSNNDDLISFRHHTYEKETYKSVALNQLGPRFEMKLYQISLGLINQPEATKQWVLRPYMNTATKRKAL